MTQAAWRRRRIRRPPTKTAPTPTTANSSMSAPVNGRLLVPPTVPGELEVEPAEVPVVDAEVAAVKGSADGVVEFPETAGGVTQPAGSFKVWVCTHVAAPAAPDAMASPATANPVPTTNRLTHIMIASSCGTHPLTPSSLETACAAPSCLTPSCRVEMPFAMNDHVQQPPHH
jgi:hypothetical protein